MNETVEIPCIFITQTESAVRVNDGERSLWLPKSQITYEDNWYDLEPDEDFILEVPEWLAKQKDLI